METLPRPEARPPIVTMWYNRPMTSADRRGMMTRLAAALHGEVAATTAEAYRRAGASAYQDMMDAGQLRGSLRHPGPGCGVRARASRASCCAPGTRSRCRRSEERRVGK